MAHCAVIFAIAQLSCYVCAYLAIANYRFWSVLRKTDSAAKVFMRRSCERFISSLSPSSFLSPFYLPFSFLHFKSGQVTFHSNRRLKSTWRGSKSKSGQIAMGRVTGDWLPGLDATSLCRRRYLFSVSFLSLRLMLGRLCFVDAKLPCDTVGK